MLNCTHIQRVEGSTRIDDVLIDMKYFANANLQNLGELSSKSAYVILSKAFQTLHLPSTKLMIIFHRIQSQREFFHRSNISNTHRSPLELLMIA